MGCGGGGVRVDRQELGRALEPFSHNSPEHSQETLAKWSMSSSKRRDIFQNKCFLKQERENIRQQLGPKIEGESENIARIANAVHCHS